MTTEAAALTLVRKLLDPAEINFAPTERSMVAWITCDVVDHEGDVVVAEGVDFRSVFLGETPDKGNPCVLAHHDMGRWPIGQCKWIQLKRGEGFIGLAAKTVFDTDADSELVWQKVKARTVRGVSIGFKPPANLKPNEWGPPTPDELRKHPNWAGARRVIRRCVLLEYSICPVGMNPAALVISVSKGLHKPAYLEERSAMSDAAEAANGGALETEIKSVASYHQSPVVDGEWDAGEARKRIREWATEGEGKVNMEKYAQAFLWCDEANREDLGSYKFPVKDVRDGKLVLVRAAVRAAASRVATADIPEGDRDRLKSLIARYEKDAGIGEANKEDEKTADTPETKDAGTMETPPAETALSIAKGMAVTMPGGKCGTVKSVHKAGKHPTDFEDGDADDLDASEQHPVARVEEHEKTADGCAPSGRMKSFHVADLKGASCAMVKAMGFGGADFENDTDADDRALLHQKVAKVAKGIADGDAGHRAYVHHDKGAVHHQVPVGYHGRAGAMSADEVKGLYKSLEGVRTVGVADEPPDDSGYHRVHPPKESKAAAAADAAELQRLCGEAVKVAKGIEGSSEHAGHALYFCSASKTLHHVLPKGYTGGEHGPDADEITTAYRAVKGVKSVVVSGDTPTGADFTAIAKDMSEGSGTTGGYTVDADGDFDDDAPIKRHDHVKITAPHHKGYGVVKSIHTDEIVPDVAEDMRGTADDPAARVRVHKRVGDGFTPTDHHVAVRTKHLTKVAPLRPPTKGSKAASPAPEPSPAPTPPSLAGAQTYEQVIKSLVKTPTADLLTEAARIAEERRLGFV